MYRKCGLFWGVQDVSVNPQNNPFTVAHTNPLEDTWSMIVKEVSFPCLVSIHTDNISNSAIMSNEYKRNSWASCWLPGTQAGSIGRTICNNYCSSQQILLCHLHNSVLSYIISGLNLLWSDRSYTSLWQCIHTEFWDSAVYSVDRTGFLYFCIHTEFWDSAVYSVDRTGFLLFCMQFTIMNTAWCMHTPVLRGITVEYGCKIPHRDFYFSYKWL